MLTFTKETLPPESDFGRFQKKTTTLAKRIDGSFTVVTDEGPLICHDGWLAIDARGWPYPINADEFGMIYEEVGNNG